MGTLEDLIARHGHGQAEVEILRLVHAWAGSGVQAEDWLSTPIVGLGSSPLHLMRSGKTDLVLGHLLRIGIGGFA